MTRYEVRTKGDGEFDHFIHPSDPEAENEAHFDETNLAEARRYAKALEGWVVEISENKVPDCPYCRGSGLDPNGPNALTPCPRCDSNVPPSTVSELIKAVISDVESMRCSMPPDFEAHTEQDSEDWFGGFSAGYADPWEGETSVQWPNLGILVAQLKELLGDEKRSHKTDCAFQRINATVGECDCGLLDMECK